METAALERSERNIPDTLIEAEIKPLCSIRWAAVIAGLIVGLSTHLVLMLIGLAAGLAVFGSGERPDGGSISLAAAIWNSLSLIIAAMVGGYIASRSSGLRRTPDGILHAVASWGASMICYVFLVSAITGTTVGGLFGIAAATTGMSGAALSRSDSDNTMAELLSSIERGDRQAAVAIMRDRFGMNADQANRAVDRATTVFGASGGVSGEGMENAAQMASAASAWLSLVVLLSLATGIGGGVIGAHGTRKRMVTTGYRRHGMGMSGAPARG